MISRRFFIQSTVCTGTGLILGFNLGSCTNKPIEITELNAFLKIGSDNSIIIISKNPEIGQGVKTAMPMIIAEELGVDWNLVQVEQAPYDERLGSQLAGGSSSIKSDWMTLREAGASALQMLKETAAELWEVDINRLNAKRGIIEDPQTGKKIPFGKLALAASKRPVPEAIELKDPAEFRIIGTSRAGVDNLGIVTGKAKFGIDVSIEGMLHAVIKRCPVFGGKVRSFDDSKAREQEGVVDIIEIQGHDHPTRWSPGVAVIANSTWAAIKGREALTVEWDRFGNEQESSDKLGEKFMHNVDQAGSILVREDGVIDRAFAEADTVIESVYELPFLAHATLEPQNFVAMVSGDEVHLIGPTQVPGTCLYLAREITGIDQEKMRLDLTRIGGGFGRRLFADYAAEAVYLSDKLGKPVRVFWDREDDMRHDFYRPAGVYKIRASILEGRLTGWHVNASTTSRYLYRGSSRSPHSSEIFSDGFPAGFIPNFKIEYTPVNTSIPTGAWRAPGHNATSFVIQSFIDEIAHANGRDSLEYRLDLLGVEDRMMPYEHFDPPLYSTGRLRQVLQEVGKMSDWQSPAPEGIFRGIACHFIFGSYVALVCELSVENQVPKVQKFFAAVDCGIVVNYSGAEAQVEGAILDGMSAAYFGNITIENGGVKEQNFDSYRLLRMSDVPEIEVNFISSNADPTGLGEIALPPVAPAICNAIYSATGRRIVKLPIL